ncbi:polysaccharide deacetylase family protein [Arthrobacter sp. MI7-26]|uniref:polysaccharide deacetylase family protein n=1 Tax=Arthrobacter sp. MI7-26 TaxID=2993653 RepID=UPI002248E1B7|nr:polysaccharide deacetylase family protein [Arthrobacter sp. MI7-26]
MGAAALLLATLFNAAILTQPAQAAGPLVVTLTFDDANADQVAAANYLNSKGMKGTFFLPSGYLNAVDPNGGPAPYMTTAQALALQTAGNEIAGHTVTHPDLAQMDANEVARQVCNDRVNLTNMGFRVTNFAYPFASATPAVQQTVANCGYNSARGLGDLKSKAAPTLTEVAEPLPVPAADLYFTKAPDEVDNTWTVADMQTVVTQAEAGGGWVQLTFHHFDSTTDPLTVTTLNFQNYVNWLLTEQTAGRIAVKTVSQVMAAQFPDPSNPALDVNKPVVNGPAAPPPITVGNLLQNPSLETAGPVASGLPYCWAIGSYGTQTSTFTSVTPGHTGNVAEQMVTTGYVSGDAKLLPTLDLGQCAPSATPGHTYQMSAWYKSTALTQFELYYRTGLGTWTYWTASPNFAAATAWTQATWTSPPVPAGASAISMGLNLLSNGTLVTDDYGLFDTISASVPGAFQSTAPSRFLDTRNTAPVAPGGTVSFQVGGVNGIPATVSAVTFNLTVTEPTSFGFVTAYPSGTTRPNASNLNYAKAQTVPNLVTVPVGTDGKVTLYNQSTGTAQLIADVSGYYLSGAVTAPGAFQPMAPNRFLDTRNTTLVAPGGTVSFQVGGVSGIPATISAVTFNLTVTEPTSFGFVSAYASGTTRPNASNLNYAKAQTVPNLITVPVGTDGKVTLFNQSTGTAQLIADVAGYYLAGTPVASGTFAPIAPNRFLDTRNTSLVAPGGTVSFQVGGVSGIPATISAVTFNLTVTEPTSFGFVTAYASGTTRPNASNLNYDKAQTVPNLVTVPVGADGKVTLYNQSTGTAQLIADVSGYFLR